MKNTNQNNFDLLRLFAATQVFLQHAKWHMDINPELFYWLSYFPGVPIFFFISGYLLYISYEKNYQNNNYFYYFFINRILRIYPALYLSFFISIFLIWFSGYFLLQEISFFKFLIWCFTSLTFFQFYNPDFLRDFGVGVINGSLWTISVELQFYILVPLIFYYIKKDITYKKYIFIAFIILNVANFTFNNFTNNYEKLYGVSFFPWLYMFLLGGFIAKNPKIIKKILKFNLFILLCFYITLYWISIKLELGAGNFINPLVYAFLIMIIIKLAFSRPYLSDRFLNRNDISYGIYVYHMPIINYMYYINFKGYFGFFISIF